MARYDTNSGRLFPELCGALYFSVFHTRRKLTLLCLQSYDVASLDRYERREPPEFGLALKSYFGHARSKHALGLFESQLQ